MGPIKLMLLLFALNAFAITGALYFIAPSKATELELQTVSIQQPESTVDNLISGKPSRLDIPAADINLEVEDGVYDRSTGEWTLSDNKAHYALITPEANNQVGNTFIYGHNKAGVFNTLDKLDIGDRANVVTDNNKIFTYTLKDVQEVKPDDVSLFKYRGTSILTIQTCSGNWYEKRKLFTFEFSKVSDR